jgi:hypothetical protein
MAKLNLENHSDQEIVEALVALPAFQFMSVIGAVGEVVKKAERRGQAVSKRMSDDLIDKLFNNLINPEEG